MSTRSYIAKQIADNKFRTIYCHSDGYLTHNGALLLDHYSEADKLDELLNLGDISCLEPTINPDPTKPHSFNYDERQEGVVIAYGRDRGDKDVDAPTESPCCWESDGKQAVKWAAEGALNGHGPSRTRRVGIRQLPGV